MLNGSHCMYAINKLNYIFYSASDRLLDRNSYRLFIFLIRLLCLFEIASDPILTISNIPVY